MWWGNNAIAKVHLLFIRLFWFCWLFFYGRLLFVLLFLIPIVLSELTKAQGETKSFAAEGGGRWVGQTKTWSFRRNHHTVWENDCFLSQDFMSSKEKHKKHKKHKEKKYRKNKILSFLLHTKNPFLFILFSLLLLLAYFFSSTSAKTKNHFIHYSLL